MRGSNAAEAASPTATPTRRTGFDLLPPQRSRHMLAVDVSSFVRRAWHACVNANRHDPQLAAPTALGMLVRILRGRQPSHALMAGEGLGSIRTGISKLYKADRPPKPGGLELCEAQVEQALHSAGVPLMKFAGLEADDVLHGAVIGAREQRLPVVVASSDKDVQALVSDEYNVTVWRGDEDVLDEAGVLARWGVHPQQLTELLAIAGDSTDGIPGAAGIGEKGAARILVASNLSLRELLAGGGYYYVPSFWRKKWLKSIEAIKLSWELARLRGEGVALRVFIEDCEVDPLWVAASLAESADSLGQDDGGAW